MTNTKQPTRWRDQIKVHPAADLFPMMTTDELKALGEDIKENWLRTNIAVWQADSGRPWFLIDGRNRLDAAELVGLSVKFKKSGSDFTVKIGSQEYALDDCSLGDPYEHIIRANVLRRHLTAEQKRDVIAALLKATPDKSNRQIAETVKASHVTVGAVRAELQSTGQIDQLTKTVGKDGKARKQPRAQADTFPIYGSCAGGRVVTERAKEKKVSEPEASLVLSPSEWHDGLSPDAAFVERCTDFAMMIEEEAERLSGDRRFQFLSIMRQTALRLLDNVGSVEAERKARRPVAAQGIEP